MRRLADTKYFVLPLLFIIILGAFLRFFRIKELGTFRGDQATELLGAAQILHGRLTLVGIKTSISEIRNGAVMYYLLAPFLWLFRFDPVAGGALQTILSLVAIIPIFFLGKTIGGIRLGLVVAFLVTTSALLVEYSRQTMLAYYPLFFVSLSLLLFWKIVEKFDSFKVFFLGTLLGFMLQIHYSTLAVLIAALLLPFFFLKRSKIAAYFLTLLAGFLLGFAPMIIFELRHEFFQTKMLGHYLRETSGIYFLAKPEAYFSYWSNILGSLYFGGNQILGALSALSLLTIATFRFLKGKVKIIERLCILQIVTTALFILLFVKEVKVVHYAISCFPSIILLTASLPFSPGLRNRSLGVNLALMAILVLFFMINFPAYQLGRDHGFSMENGWNLPGVEKAAKLIVEDVDGKKFNVAMAVDMENQALPLRYFLFISEKSPLGVEYYGEAEALYVVANLGTNLRDVKMWEITAFGPFCIKRFWPIQSIYRLYRLEKNLSGKDCKTL